ncbi:unnamed protein product [Periconia digitata]|uniref:Uncharacterized protein n=1 Tax=Periconia digitata TaxID=1303443 RepID=A0A9W4UU87_9PLEO|nr:unnamed protein product [Periconia digitata]
MDCIPLPICCFQCGTDQNPCHCKVVGPTIGFFVTVGMALVCWPASLVCCCCATDAGKKYVYHMLRYAIPPPPLFSFSSATLVSRCYTSTATSWIND